MIGAFFVSLFKIDEQADHYWLQAAKINEARLHLRPMTSRRLKVSLRAVNNTSKAFQDLGIGMRALGKQLSKSLLEFKKERLN